MAIVQIIVNFTECSPTPANGYNIQYKVVGDVSFIDAGNFTSSPATISVNYPDGTIFEGFIRSDCGGSVFGTEIPLPFIMGLRLLFDDIANAPVGDPSSVSDWNTFFDMGVEAASPFTQVVVNGNEVILIGAIGMNMKDDSFSTNNNIISVIDEVDCVISVGANVFLLSSSIQTILLPVVTTVGNSAFQSTTLAVIDLHSLQVAGIESFHDAIWIPIFDLPVLTDAGESCFMGCNATQFLLPLMVNAGFSCFSQCLNVTDFYFPSCTNLGGTTGDDLVFLNTTGTTVTLTIPTATATDDDVVYLQANNTVTLITV